MGIWVGTPDLTVGLYIWKGIVSNRFSKHVSAPKKRVRNEPNRLQIPAGLGNIIGGAVFCGGYYWLMYLWGEEPIAIDGVHYEPMHDLKTNGGFHLRSKKDMEGGDSVTRSIEVGS